jgi:hypothetical protein
MFFAKVQAPATSKVLSLQLEVYTDVQGVARETSAFVANEFNLPTNERP